MFSRILYIIFTIYIGLNSTLGAMAEQPVVNVSEQKPEAKPEEKKDALAQIMNDGVNDFLNFDQEEVLKNIMEFYRKSIAKRQEDMLKKAPEALRNDIIEAKEIYQEFVATFNLPDCLLVLCQELRRDLDKLAQANGVSPDDQEKLQALLNELEALHIALISGSFKALIDALKPEGDAAWQMPFMNTFDLGSMMSTLEQGMQQRRDSNEPYEEDDLIALHQALTDLLATKINDQSNKLKPALQRMHNMVTALKDKDAPALVVYAMTCLDHNFIKTHNGLSEILQRLDDGINALGNNLAEKETKKILEFWRRDIAKYTRSLNVFASIKHHAGFRTPEGSYTFFKIITRAYQASHGLLELYQKDLRYDQYREHPRHDQSAMVISSAMDWAFTSSLSLWYFFAQQADHLNDLVTDTVLGTKSISSLDEKQVLLYQGIAAIQALPIAYDPGVWSKPSTKIMKIAGKISTAFVYHHLFHVRLFGNRSQGIWPNTDDHMKTALMYALTTGKNYVSSKIVSEVYWNTDPETLGNLEKWTLGVVKPEIIGEAIDILFPFFFLRPDSYVQNVVKFDRKDLFKGHGIDYDALKKRFDRGEDAEKSVHEARIDREYIERNVLNYICSSVGMYGGTYVATKYQKPLSSLMKKTAGGFGRALVALDIVSKDTFDELGNQCEDLEQEFEQILVFAKMMLKNVLQEGSPIRNKMVPLLEERGLLRASDNTPILINKRIVYIVLNLLATHRLVSYLEAAAINRAFKKDPTNLDSTIDSVVDAVRNNLFGMAGGVVGSQSMSWLGWALYPKVKEFFGNPVVTG